jgi:hypothetical protein
MQEELFMKYLHNLGQQIGSMFSEEAAGTVQDAFFKNLKINKTRDISVNDVISKREEKINDIRKEIQKQATGTEGMSLEDATAYAKKNRLTSIGYNSGNNVSVQGTEGQSPIFGNTGQTYPAYELQGAEFAPIIENFVKRAVGRDSNINELMKNAMTNVRNIPLAMFYGENVPISNMKDLLTYALYNKAKEYPVNIDVPGFRVTNTEKQGRIGIYYEGSGGGGANKDKEIQKNATYTGQEGKNISDVTITTNPDGTNNIYKFNQIKIGYKPVAMQGTGKNRKAILNPDGSYKYEPFTWEFKNDAKGNLFVTKWGDDGEKIEGGTKPVPTAEWATVYNEAMRSVNSGYGAITYRKSEPFDNGLKSSNIRNKNLLLSQTLLALDATGKNNNLQKQTGDININDIRTDVVDINAKREKVNLAELNSTKRDLINKKILKNNILSPEYWDKISQSDYEPQNDIEETNNIYNVQLISNSELHALADDLRIPKEEFKKLDQLSPDDTRFVREKSRIISRVLAKINFAGGN